MSASYSDGITRTIMVIDDEQDFREAMDAFLDEYGYKVVKANGGEEAFRLLEETEPQLIFLDVNMPKISGLEVLSRLKGHSQYAKIPVIMLTGRGETNTIMQAQELGAADFLSKPFEMNEILNLIRNYVA